MNEFGQENDWKHTIHDAINHSTGDLLLGHLIQEYQLPTWKTHETVNISTPIETQTVTKTFYNLGDSTKKSEEIKKDGIDKNRELLECKETILPKTRYIRFYEHSESLFSWMIVAGMLIEQNSIDGFMVQTTNTEMNLSDSNSFYYQGTIPEKIIEEVNLNNFKDTP